MYDLLRGMLTVSTPGLPDRPYTTDTVVNFLHDKERKSIDAQPEGPGYAHYIVRLSQEKGNDIRTPGLAIGSVAVFCRQSDMPAELGYALFGSYHGQGFATEAVGEVLRHLRQDLGVKDVCALVRPTNIKSRRVLEKLGFNEKGSINMLGQPGQGDDTVQYGVFLLPDMEPVTAKITWY